MPTLPARGPCPRCQQMNVYTKYTCDYCGDRLPWADTFAATSGEKCPHCGQFNPYIHTDCSACHEQLPWHDAAAPRRFARGDVEATQKPVLMVIVLGVLACLIVIGWVFLSLAPTAR